jgi:nucleotide-binding universal stress UspA family protein
MDTRRIVTGLSGSPGSLQALRFAADLARVHDAELMPVLAWMPPGGEAADRRYPCPELREEWADDAWKRLWHALDLGLGGPPADIAFVTQVVRGEAGRVLTQIAQQPGDLLVIGAGRPGGVRRLAAKVSRYCVAHANCPVIAVPPAQLAADVHGVRAWVSRHRVHPEDADLHVADA